MKLPENEQPPQRGDSEQIRAANLNVVNEDRASPEIQELYWHRVHGGSASALGAVLARDSNSHSVNANERTLLQFVWKITEDSHAITAADIEDMRVTEWTDLQIAEAIHVTALFASFNRVVNAFGLPSQGLLKQFEQAPQNQKHGDALA